jgi:hypothetical protein
MADFWKSGERIYCDHCEVYVRFNLVKQHQQTPKHKSRVERALSAQRAGRTKGGIEQDKVDRELARMERLATGSVLNDVAAGRARNHETAATFATAVKPRPYAPRPPQAAAGQTSSAAAPVPRQPKSAAEEMAALWNEEEERREEAEVVVDEEAEAEKARVAAEAESQRRDALARDNYDPSNPYGQWVAASPPRAAPEDDDEGDDDGEREPGAKSRKQQRAEQEERFEEDVEEDADMGFEIKRVGASDRVFNETVGLLGGDEVKQEEGEEEPQVVFKEKSKKDRSSRKRAKNRDINE